MARKEGNQTAPELLRNVRINPNQENSEMATIPNWAAEMFRAVERMDVSEQLATIVSEGLMRAAAKLLNGKRFAHLKSLPGFHQKVCDVLAEIAHERLDGWDVEWRKCYKAGTPEDLIKDLLSFQATSGAFAALKRLEQRNN